MIRKVMNGGELFGFDVELIDCAPIAKCPNL